MVLNAKDLFKICDDMDKNCIEFAEWCDDIYFRMGNTSYWALSMDWDNETKFTTTDLLEMWKEEKFKHLINK
jgi:hypothetical protein